MSYKAWADPFHSPRHPVLPRAPPGQPSVLSSRWGQLTVGVPGDTGGQGRDGRRAGGAKTR